MDLLTWGRNPWGQDIWTHISWALLWVSIIGGAAFMIIHTAYVRLWPKPATKAAKKSTAKAAKKPAKKSATKAAKKPAPKKKGKK